ncbi:hypothetical protein GCM10007116_18550 [Sulfodiicoccus acidiphilus]|uniref:Uncharacterized protein n=1 Tax=Sulfodiicoccus acidiphilus TaxID=1670455 RepID=A0A830H1U3_9CREN|nr:hypothetical protein GCM10007116_18550 [Sulfodiicoccus acidiphilus]
MVNGLVDDCDVAHGDLEIDLHRPFGVEIVEIEFISTRYG